MAKNLLIDTCVWRELVSQVEFNGYLKQLIYWFDNDEITLYRPEVLKTEWEKHRLEVDERINKAIKNHQKDLKKSTLFNVTPDFAEAQINVADKTLKSQIAEIDKLLQKAVAVTDEVKAAYLAFKHKQENKAPFLRKEASEKDAVLIFSMLEALQAIGETELYFFSSNHTDYGSTDDPHTTIHDDISSLYPEIRISYFSKLPEGIAELISQGLPSTKKAIAPASQVKNLIPVDRQIPMIDQLHSYFEKRFDDIRFLPKHLFTRHYPFIQGTIITRVPEAFTVNTDNPELWEWFSEVSKLTAPLTVDENSLIKSEESAKKLKEIVNILHGNLAYFISLKAHQSVDIPFLDDRTCDCVLCRYQDFKFHSVLVTLNERPKQPEISLKQAYAHYLTGQLHSAVEILKKVVAEAAENKKMLTYAIANFNLSQLGLLLEYETHRGSDIATLITELKETKLDRAYEVAGSALNDDILKYLSGGDFVKKAHRRMQVLVNKIRDDFHEGNNGWNNQTRDLIELYNETSGFIRHNYIMYDSFYEFSELSKLFIEGILASFACRNTLGGKLIHIDEGIAEKMVLYGNHEEIRKLAQRYKIKTITFEANDVGFSFIERLVNLLNEYDLVVETFTSFDPEGTGIFWSRYRRYFQNSLTLAGLLDIAQDDLRRIADCLLVFLKKEKHFQEYELTKTLRFFLFKKYELLTDDQIRAFMLFGYTSDSISRELLTETLNAIAEKRTLKLALSESDWQDIQSDYLINKKIERLGRAIDLICNLYDVLPYEVQKQEIRNFISHYLKEEFVPEIYYTALMYDIISPKKKYTVAYIASIDAIIGRGRTPRPFNQKEYYSDHRVDEFINFTIKYDITIDSDMRTRLAEMDDYYNWLLNLETFDYSSFNTEWLFNHYTKHFIRHYNSSKKLKSYLRQLCKTSDDLNVLRLYLNVFDNPDSDKDV